MLASLSSDIGQITIAFVRLPELVQGLVLTLGSIIDLGLLSPALLGVTALTGLIGLAVFWLVGAAVGLGAPLAWTIRVPAGEAPQRERP